MTPAIAREQAPAAPAFASAFASDASALAAAAAHSDNFRSSSRCASPLDADAAIAAARHCRRTRKINTRISST